MALKSASKDSDHRDQTLTITQLRQTSFTHKQKLIFNEAQTDWLGVFWVNAILLNTSIYVILNTMWMIAVESNMDLI